MIPINSPAHIHPDATLDDPLGIKALEQAGVLIKDITPAEARPDSAIYLPPAERSDSPPITFRGRFKKPAKIPAVVDEAWESDQEAYDRARDKIMAPLWGEPRVRSGTDRDVKQVIATLEGFQFDDSRSDSSSVYSREAVEEEPCSSPTEVSRIDSGIDRDPKEVSATLEEFENDDSESGVSSELPDPNTLITSYPFNSEPPCENGENFRAKWRLEAASELGRIVRNISQDQRSAYFEKLVKFSEVFLEIILCYYSQNLEKIPDSEEEEQEKRLDAYGLGKHPNHKKDMEKDIETKQMTLFGETYVDRVLPQIDDDEDVGPKGEKTPDDIDKCECECEFCKMKELNSMIWQGNSNWNWEGCFKQQRKKKKGRKSKR